LPASLKILIVPLDWGLGHTTRCIPIIRYLLAEGHQVIAAGEGAPAKLLLENFPGLSILPLAGYNIRYSTNKNAFTAKILLQVPRILSAIAQEKKWLEEQQQIHHFDMVISDNRYGLYHDDIPCVIMTHQLQIKSGQGKVADALLRSMHYRMLQRFDQCWVVDREQAPFLSGDLAHPGVLPGHHRYIGWLSQFSRKSAADKELQQDKEILLLLSGPEPMRGQLESILLRQIQDIQGFYFTLVAGNPLGESPGDLPKNVGYYTHLNAAQLENKLQRARLVICRSGYSTLMDLMVMQKNALLIPTPGQTEQEYLAAYLSGNNYFHAVAQHKLDLSADIPKALGRSGSMPSPTDVRQMEDVIDAFIAGAGIAGQRLSPSL
jgi:predicted glycosyltransferase